MIILTDFFPDFVRFAVIYIKYIRMRMIKMGVNSLEKNVDDEKTQPLRKTPLESRNKVSANINIRSDEVPQHQLSDPVELDSPHNEIYPIAMKSNPAESQKANKSTLKLPSINTRNFPHSQVTHTIPEPLTTDQVDYIIQHFELYKNGTSNPSRRHNRNSLKESKNQSAQGDRVGDFLKYIHVRSMKPEKSPSKPNDLSVRDLKMSKNEKKFPLVIIAKPSQVQLIRKNKLDRKSSEKTAFRKFDDRFEKNQKPNHYSIRKERKALSITQPMKKKPLTNTYSDFCHYICLLNRIITPAPPLTSYKAYIARGNNSILVKNSLKNRFWWILVDVESEANLHWTQARDLKCLQNLKCYEKGKRKEQQEKKTGKMDFHTSKEQTQKVDQLKQHTGIGLGKLLSPEQKKKYMKSSNVVEIPFQNTYRKLPTANKLKIHNHLEYHWHISNKKALYYNLKKYYEAIKENPFQYIPLTFHIKKQEDEQWNQFEKTFHLRTEQILKKSENKLKKKKEKNLWIIKPGENSNQGCGIQVFDSLEQMRELIKNKEERSNGKSRSFIIQKYLMPFLYNKRKFDIRCYVLVTSINEIVKAYWYEEGYIRTSSKQFTTKNLKNRMIHLTNDAIQKKSEDYGKYENGNKISFSDFQRYLDISFPDKQYKFHNTIYPAMIKCASDTIKSTCMLLDANHRQFSFEIFGLDYMIDEDFQVWLIEVNTNPCLELSSPLLARIIPHMMENALKIAVDPLFPPPKQYPKTKTMASDLFENNKFTLIFNSSQAEDSLLKLTRDTNLSQIIQSDEQDENHDDIQ